MLNLGESKIYNPYDVYTDQIKDDQIKYLEFHNKLKRSLDSILDFVFNTAPADFIKDRISIPLSLNENQSKEIAKIVMEIIITDFYLGDIVRQIKQRVFVDEQKAKTIAGLIVAELFAPILEELKKKHIEKFAKNMPLQSPQQSDDRTVDLRQNG